MRPSHTTTRLLSNPTHPSHSSHRSLSALLPFRPDYRSNTFDPRPADAKPLTFKDFNTRLQCRNPMKYRQFQHKRRAGLNGKGILPDLCRLKSQASFAG